MKTEQGAACWKTNEMGMWRRKKEMKRKFRVSAVVAASRGRSELDFLVAEEVFEGARGEQSTQQKLSC